MCNTTQVHVKYITSPFVIPVVYLFHVHGYFIILHPSTHTSTPFYTPHLPLQPLHLPTHTTTPLYTLLHIPYTLHTLLHIPLHPTHPPTPLYTLHTPPHSRVMPSQRSQRWHSLTWAGNPSSPWSMCPWMEQACDAWW